MSAARLIGLAWLAFVWLALALFASGCTTSRQADRNAPPASQFAAEASQGSGAVSLVPALPEPVLADGGGGITAGDVLAVQVFGVPELDRTVQVDGGGQIALPLIGAVRAAGQSPRALERSVAQLYGARYLQAPQVGVIVKESFGQRVTVDGAVNRAGMYSSAGDASLLQIIALAGGFGPTADPSRVVVFRKVGAKRYAASFDMKRVREGRAADPLVAGGDVVIVPDSSSKLARNNLKDILGLAGSVGTLAALGL